MVKKATDQAEKYWTQMLEKDTLYGLLQHDYTSALEESAEFEFKAKTMEEQF